MNKIIFVGTLFAALAFTPVAFAAGVIPTQTCQPIYGGGQTCVQTGNLSINKKVANPQNGSFVDNLGTNDPKYGPDQTVTFQIVVTNTGNSTLSKIHVEDILPQFITLVGNNKFDIDSLNANDSKTFTVTGKVASANGLPSDQAITCVVNQATATVDNKMSQDNAQFCIEKNAPQPTQPTTKGGIPTETKGGQKVFPQQPVTSTPNTGPEALALVALLPAGALGAFLRKKSR